MILLFSGEQRVCRVCHAANGSVLLLRLAKAFVARFCRRSAVFFSTNTGRLFVGVGRKQPVTTGMRR